MSHQETFQVGDKVVLKPRNELRHPYLKDQEVGVGVVIEFLDNWIGVRWENGLERHYRYGEIVKFKEGIMERTIPSKEQVLEAAEKCPQSKDALRILFPQDFEDEKPLKPGVYRDADGKICLLFLDTERDWRLAHASGFLRDPDDKPYFPIKVKPSMVELRRILSTMERVQLP